MGTQARGRTVSGLPCLWKKMESQNGKVSFLFDVRISLSHRPYQTWIAFYEDGWPTRILQFSVYIRYMKFTIMMFMFMKMMSLAPLSNRACSGKDRTPTMVPLFRHQ